MGFVMCIPGTTQQAEIRINPLCSPPPDPIFRGLPRVYLARHLHLCPQLLQLAHGARAGCAGDHDGDRQPQLLGRVCSRQTRVAPCGKWGIRWGLSPPHYSWASPQPTLGPNYLRSKRSHGSPSWQPEMQEGRRDEDGCVPLPCPHHCPYCAHTHLLAEVADAPDLEGARGLDILQLHVDSGAPRPGQGQALQDG